MLSLSILSIASLMLSSAALAGKRRTHKTPVGRSCFLLRQLRNVAQNLKQRRGEGAVFLLLDAVEKGLEPRVHHRPYPLERCSPLLGEGGRRGDPPPPPAADAARALALRECRACGSSSTVR